jgi:4-amino-4-deoxy-L-arabinose transferase-like glycosyltransferase
MPPRTTVDTSAPGHSAVSRALAVGLTLLALAAFVAQVLHLGSLRLQPRYDEVHYLSIARDYHRMGGVAAVIRCHLAGLCQEDNRYPVFELLLQGFARDAPGFYADAKLLTIGTSLLLFAVLFGLAWRRFSPRHAVAAVVLLALMPTVGEVSSGVLADPLFAAVVVLAVAVIGACQTGGWPSWLGAGCLIGFAYLTKGNGHLLFVALIVVGLAVHRGALVRRAGPYVAGLGFVAVASFLLVRNTRMFGSPFHNFNDHSLWLDGWDDTWRLMRSSEWTTIGLGYYLHHHPFWMLPWRLLRGLGQTLAVLLYTAGLGVTAATPIHLLPGTVAVITRVATAIGAMLLAMAGLRARLREGHRAEVWAVSVSCGLFVAAFSLGGQGVGGVATRFMLPLVAVLVPYVVHGLLGVAIPRLSRRAAQPSRRLTALAAGLAATALALKLVWFAPALAHNPRNAVAVPADWAEMSAWFAAHLLPGERYAFPSGSLYSTFDRPTPDPDARWIYTYRVGRDEMQRVLDRALPLTLAPRWDGAPRRISKVFVDREDKTLAGYREQFSTGRDEHGPMTFFGWPRCFADSGRPSRFLVYCR